MENKLSIQNKAVLVDLKISTWSAIATDRKISEEINITKTGSNNSGKYMKKLLPSNNQIKQIQKLANQLRRDFHSITLDWEGTSRIMPIEKLDEWMKAYNDYLQQWNSAIERFVDAYPESINKAQLALGDLFNINDYPEPQDIHKYFGLTQKLKAIPTDDFRFETDSETIKQLQEDAKNAAEQQTNKVIKAFLEKLLLDINRVINATDPSAKRTRGSLFTTLQNTLNNAKAFNLNSDPELDSLIEEGLSLIDDVGKTIPKEQKDIINKQANNLMQRIQSYGRPVQGS